MAEHQPGADAIACPRCGAAHRLIACPYVKAVVFEFGFVDGAETTSISRVEFLTPADYGRPAPAVPPDKDYPRLGG